MASVVISPSNVLDYPEGGGHIWVYMQYVLGFRALGCDVYWLENFCGADHHEQKTRKIVKFTERMRQFGLIDKFMIHVSGDAEMFPDFSIDSALSGKEAESICRHADLLINFSYSQDIQVLSLFRRTALIDVDPGLLQFWISQKQICVGPHDVYFSTGETVGKPEALFPDCGLHWNSIRPVVSLADWPVTYNPNAVSLTTISGWWGGGEEGEWISNGADINYENNKRVSFLEFAELPSLTQQSLELALSLGDGDNADTLERTTPDADDEAPLTDYVSDAVDRAILEASGWHIRPAVEVAASPNSYQRYIQSSRGEFSCAKPSCMKFQNAWVSDRTLCYLASAKPVIVQNTGPSEVLPDAMGMFRFVALDDAASAIEALNDNYKMHCTAARDIAETYFDAVKVLTKVLNIAL